MVNFMTAMTRNEKMNITTLMADPKAQVPVSPNCWDRLMPKDVAFGPPRKRGVMVDARHGMKTSTVPIEVPIQFSGQVTSMNARNGPAPFIFAVSKYYSF